MNRRNIGTVRPLGYVVERSVRCAVCDALITDAWLHDRRDSSHKDFHLTLRCHGATEMRTLSDRAMRLGKVDDFLAPAFQQQAHFRKRKDPAMLKFNRRRKSQVRGLGA